MGGTTKAEIVLKSIRNFDELGAARHLKENSFTEPELDRIACEITKIGSSVLYRAMPYRPSFAICVSSVAEYGHLDLLKEMVADGFSITYEMFRLAVKRKHTSMVRWMCSRGDFCPKDFVFDIVYTGDIEIMDLLRHHIDSSGFYAAIANRDRSAIRWLIRNQMYTEENKENIFRLLDDKRLNPLGLRKRPGNGQTEKSRPSTPSQQAT
jgi:hypothetical protein